MKNMVLLTGKIALLLMTVCMQAEDISSIDRNFRAATVGNLPVHYFNALEKPFELTGFPWRKPGEPLYRIPKNLTPQQVNYAVLRLAGNTSGGAVRFKTDSPYITLRVVYDKFGDMPHMSRTGSGGFDLYVNDSRGNGVFLATLLPPNNPGSNPVEQRIGKYGLNKVYAYTLYLPLYSSIKQLELGLKPGAKLLPPDPQKISKPILFYGSSITQGACASRPGTNYTTMLCRALDAPQINLGFSGGAKGEPSIAEAIGTLDPAAFVMDYDYNAANVSELEKTHEPFFLAVRKARPDLPVIMISCCTSRVAARTAVIRKTYDNAIKRGDKNVYFIDGRDFFGEAELNCTVDRTHPNDLGFYRMYCRILPVLQQALGLKK